MLHLYLLLTVHLPHRLASPLRRRDEGGQATAEYALVLLAAAAIALAVVSWATRTSVIGRLLDAVFRQLVSRVG